jgi:hypothetical protein
MRNWNRFRRRWSWPNLGHIPEFSWRDWRKTHKKYRDNRCPGGDSNWVPSRYEFRALALGVPVETLFWNVLYVCLYPFWVSIPVAARSKAWAVFARSDRGIVGSNHTRGIDVSVRLFCACAVLCAGSGLPTSWSPSEESYRLNENIKKLKKRPRSNKGL